MENEVYKKTICEAKGRVTSDILVLTEEPNGFHIWVVIDDGDPIHIEFIGTRTSAVDHAVRYAQDMRQAVERDGLNTVGLMQFVLGYKDGLVSIRRQCLLDTSQRNQFIAGRQG